MNQQDLPAVGESNPIEFVDTTIKHGSSISQSLRGGEQQNTEVVKLPENVRVENSPSDFTPAKFITLLFTDLGVLTPSAVSDELIRLYQ